MTPHREPRLGFVALLAALVLCGALARGLPLFDVDGRLLRQFPTEDAYLMLTIARNIAIGKGMSVSDGTIPTDGTQPLMAMFWALGFRATGGDKVAGVGFALIVQLFVSGAAAWCLFLLGKRVTGCWKAAALGAAVWYATMLAVRHSMNCLETGMYTLVIVLFLIAFLGPRGDPLSPWPARRAVGLGCLLSLAFWTRNDAVFLIVAACVVRALMVDGARVGVRAANIVASCLMGAVAFLLASPWLAYCYFGFGNIVPVSATAQSWMASFGENLPRLVANLAEYALVIAPIPRPWELEPVVTALCALVVLSTSVVVVIAYRRSPCAPRVLIAVASLYGLLLCGYYGMYFGAEYFLSRYLFPLSPFLTLLWAFAALRLWPRLPVPRRQLAAAVASVMLVVLVAAPNLRLYRKGKDHMHFAVVEWVQEHVPDDTWVGAIQSGTLGFFHDRTINLDGKVNPEALEANLRGELSAYVLSKPIDYLADWIGLATWANDPVLAPHFELLVEDPERNLAVLARRH